MNNKIKIIEKNKQENGAALVTVLMISVLLAIACIAMLSAVGANSQNSTDVLSETKAYYAAESGLQATINVLRNKNITYSQAVQSGTLENANWLIYDYVNGTDKRVVVGEPVGTYTPNKGTAYKIFVTDPDNTSNSITFNTSGTFSPYTGGVLYDQGKKLCIPDCPGGILPSPGTEITFIDAPSTTHTFTSNPSNPNPRLGSFGIRQEGGGVNINPVKFQIDYRLTAPRAKTITIGGSINKPPPNPDPNPNPNPDPKNAFVIFDTQEYKLLGSKIELCSETNTPNLPSPPENVCPQVNFNLTSASPVRSFYGDITPLEPYRLLVKSTGYGPNGAKKELEAIIQKNFLNGESSGAATTMLGTNTTPAGGLSFLFSSGNSNGTIYSGGDCNSTSGCVPSFGLTDPQNLAYVTANPPANNPAQMTPPPAMLSNNIPSWQQTPEALDALVDQFRTTAQNSGRYFLNTNGTGNLNVGNTQDPPGSFTDGTGITFCEGSCDIGASGGGILVVTGKLTNVGNFSFKGMIIVTGEEGWDRNGAGQGQVIGNIIIAPYNKRTYVPENLSSTFLAPRYQISGGGGSDVIYDDISATLDNTSAISDFMVGIAEK